MLIFILEDDPIRIKIFEERYKDHNLVIATGYWPALALHQVKYDLFLLDHDLVLSDQSLGQIGNQTHTKTGKDFVKWYLEHVTNDLWPSQVIVHSWNPPGAKDMIDLLTDARIPAIYEAFKH